MAWTNTYDTEGLDGSIHYVPRIDNELQKIVKAIQERLNDGAKGGITTTSDYGDHYMPLTLTEISDVEAGQHRKATIREWTVAEYGVGETDPDPVTGAVIVYCKTATEDNQPELYGLDEADNKVRLTTGGQIAANHNLNRYLGNDNIDFTGDTVSTWYTLDDMDTGLTDIDTLGGDVLVTFNGAFYDDDSGEDVARLYFRVMVDDVEKYRTGINIVPVASKVIHQHVSIQHIETALAAGAHSFHIEYMFTEGSWKQLGATYNRVMTVRELN